MRKNLLPIVSLLLSTFFLMAGAGLQGILLPVRASLEGWSPYEIGLMGTSYAIGFTLGCVTMPTVVRSAGHVRSFSALAALLAIAILVHGIAVETAPWVIARGFSGFALAGAYMVIESWLNERVTNETRGRVFSIYMVVSMVAMIAGQFAMPLADPALPTVFMICAIFFAMAVIPNALSRAPSPKPLTQVRLDVRSLYRNSPAAVAGVFLSGILSGAWINMAPVLGQDIGLSTTEISTLLVATMAGGAILQVPLGRLSDRVDRRYVLALSGTIGLGAALCALTLWSGGSLTLFAIAAVIGGVIYPTYSLAVAHANDIADPSDFVKISGGLLVLYGFGTMGGPMLAAWLMQTYGPDGIFIATGGAHLALLVYTLARISLRSPSPANRRPEFQSVPLARVQTPASVTLDPRADAALER
ncbi:MFS transporter [Aureimonas phyllosphaerae]|uniref:MFS family permease n=1 Tax=Aureimonas phyllosphaerae TaxID=1166078 RepID=A0A7W6BSB4_9HYPH|nr:MFS transporter [Aureimonas phyllosphaerae]MBB3935109.1 MFS family permease [Aureimonas phyllosphaerae]MBB3959117.1 MFS family permease [Aureimonas phyllosphaerae]SFF07769.1 Predicted arabinose efflux permease, MFS family [Aureimonas phyllosphaerae]